MGEEFDYKRYIGSLPIERGDTLDVASDLLSIYGYCRQERLTFDPRRLLAALEESVGPDGTVMIRAFSWAFCKGEPFDRLHSPSQVGAFGNAAQKCEGYVRTRHPLYSWWVRGRLSDELAGCDFYSSFGADSMFRKLCDLNVKQISLGNIPKLSLTYIHHAEVLSKVPYRWEKAFSGEYRDTDGSCSTRTYGMHVRPLNIEVTTANLQTKETQDLFREMGYRVDASPFPELSCALFFAKDLTVFLQKEFTENAGRRLIRAEGGDGYDQPSIDWTTAKFI